MDINMFVLFFIAVAIVYISFHTPELSIMEDMTDEELEGTEFKTKNAIAFFICASVMLVFLYKVIDTIGTYLEFFIAIICSLSVGTIIEELMINFFSKKLFPLTGKASELKQFLIPIPWVGKCIGTMNWLDAVTMTSGLIISLAWFFTKNWVLNNVLGICMCFTFLKTIRMNKLLPGLLLLCLLFGYDIFWVFYSTNFTENGDSVMVKVATGFDAPIKILMPHISLWDYPSENCSLLGLGDIVIPGIYIGFLIRFGR
jgi:signal peptide peptidase-like protein 2B